MGISTQQLIDLFQYALDNHWGYIWGTAGVLWTEAKQRAATREQTQLYGRKWIGHTVADCSGLFAWAFKKLGGYMYHGSNGMYKSYCTAKGPLKNGQKGGIQPLQPGTAVFTGTESDHGHVGLYIGNGEVIEAKGTQSGVIKSKVTDKKWTWWGELKGVDYGDTGFPDTSGWRPTIRRGSKGDDVTELQGMLDKLGYDLGPCGIDGDYGRVTAAAVRDFQQDNGLTVDGVCGVMTWAALDAAIRKLGDAPPEKRYTVTIEHLKKAQADAVKAQYPAAAVSEEKE